MISNHWGYFLDVQFDGGILGYTRLFIIIYWSFINVKKAKVGYIA